MKRRKIFTAVTTVAMSLLLTFSLTACGGKDSGTANTNGGKTESGNEPISLSQAVNQKQIWFESNGTPGKDESISKILLFNGDGTVTTYGVVNKTFADIKDMSYDDIESKLEEWDKEYFEFQINALRNDAKQYAEDATGEPTIDKNYNVVMDALDSAKYEVPVAKEFKLHIETDDSGNNTKQESISFERPTLPYATHNGDIFVMADSGDLNIEWKYSETTYDFEIVMGRTTVYDKEYASLSEDLHYIVDDEHPSITFDTPDTEGIEVD